MVNDPYYINMVGDVVFEFPLSEGKDVKVEDIVDKLLSIKLTNTEYKKLRMIRIFEGHNSFEQTIKELITEKRIDI